MIVALAADRSTAMIVALTAVVPGMTAVPAVMIAIPITFPRLGHDATGCDCHQRDKKADSGDSLFNCHIRS
jgi:hypothetical protein